LQLDIEDPCQLYSINIRVLHAPHAVGTALVVGGMCEIINFPTLLQNMRDMTIQLVSVYKVKFKEAVK
jgi:hypothetical protein